MADVRRARRDAEKAALEALSGTLVEAAGELGVALAGQAEAADNVAAARAKAKTLVEAAEVEGAALIATAEAEAAKADDTYAVAWHASKDAGWNPVQLRGMGYARPPAARRGTPAADVATDRDAGSEHVANVA